MKAGAVAVIIAALVPVWALGKVSGAAVVPDHVEITHRVVITVDGLEDLRPVPNKIRLELPRDFRITWPTKFTGELTTDGDVEVGGTVQYEEAP